MVRLSFIKFLSAAREDGRERQRGDCQVQARAVKPKAGLWDGENYREVSYAGLSDRMRKGGG